MKRYITDKQIKLLVSAYKSFRASQRKWLENLGVNPNEDNQQELKARSTKLFSLIKKYETSLDEVCEYVDFGPRRIKYIEK